MSTEVEEPTNDPVKGEQFISMAQARMVCWARKQRIEELKAENEKLKMVIEQLQDNLGLKCSKIEELTAENRMVWEEIHRLEESCHHTRTIQSE